MCEHYPYFAAYSRNSKEAWPTNGIFWLFKIIVKIRCKAGIFLHTTNKQWLSYFTTSPRLTAKNALKQFNLYKREAICKKSSCSGNFIGHLFPNSFWFLSWKNHDWALKVSCEQVGWLAGWCKGWCEVKVEQLCIIYPASQFSSIHPGLSLYKKKLVGASSHKWGQLGRIGKWFIDIVPIWWSWWHRREEMMRMTKVYQNAWKAKETASMTNMLIIRLEGQRWRNPWWDYQKVSDSGTALPLVAPSVAPLQCTGGQIGAFAANGANYVDNENEHDDELFPS